jgi:hypothetical protein
MSTKCITKPKFALDQTVSFIGGKGKIKSYRQQSDRWTYTIEMSLGVKPDFGRIGAETTIMLEESDILPINKSIVKSNKRL